MAGLKVDPFKKTESGLYIPIEKPEQQTWTEEDFLRRYEPRFISALRDYFSLCDGCAGEGKDCPKCKGRGLMLEVPEVQLNYILARVFHEIEVEDQKVVAEVFREMIKRVFSK